jgi:hypothetical protein
MHFLAPFPMRPLWLRQPLAQGSYQDSHCVHIHRNDCSRAQPLLHQFSVCHPFFSFGLITFNTLSMVVKR